MSYESVISRAQPGCLIIMLDQSGSMSLPWGDAGQSKAEVLADIVNELVASAVVRSTSGDSVRDYFEVGVVGYGDTKITDVFQASNAPGPSTQLSLHPISQVALMPKRIEDRVQIVEDRFGNTHEAPYKMPIWVEPQSSGGTPMCAALDAVVATAASWTARHPDSYPPLVFNVTDAASTDGDPTLLAGALTSLSTQDGAALLFNIHVSESARGSVVFPQNTDAIHNDAYAVMLYQLSSILPPAMVRAAQEAGMQAGPLSRGFAHNADPASLVEVLDIGTAPLLGDQIKIHRP